MNNQIILLVEDNADDRELTMMALAKNNIANEVVFASDVRKSVEFDTFVESTRQMGVYWLLLNEPPP